MTPRRTLTAALGVLSLLLALAGLTMLYDEVDRPIARFLAGDGSEASQPTPSQVLGLAYALILMLAGWIGGRFLRGASGKERLACFMIAIVPIVAFRVLELAPGILSPTRVGGGWWFLMPVMLATGWGYGSGSVGEASGAGSAGAAAGDAGTEAWKRRDDISDLLN